MFQCNCQNGSIKELTKFAIHSIKKINKRKGQNSYEANNICQINGRKINATSKTEKGKTDK